MIQRHALVLQAWRPAPMSQAAFMGLTDVHVAHTSVQLLQESWLEHFVECEAVVCLQGAWPS
jgi:hypothetical protein